MPVNPDARLGYHTPTADGKFRAPFVGQQLRCEGSAGRKGGEGFAFVLQAMGTEVAGCEGRGVGYASTTWQECERGGIHRSVAVQFDTHHHARTVKHETCVEFNTKTKECLPGAKKITERLEYERQHSVAVFVNGINTQKEALVIVYLDRYEPRRLDDGKVHQATIQYSPAAAGFEGRLTLTFDPGRPENGGARLDRPTFVVPITLPFTRDGEELPGSVESIGNGTMPFVGPHRAYVGFTASTGEASEKHDILSASFCHKLGCAEM